MGVSSCAIVDLGEEPVERLHASELSGAEREPTRMAEPLTRFILDVRLCEPRTEKRERPRAILVEGACFAEKLARAAIISASAEASGGCDQRLHAIRFDRGCGDHFSRASPSHRDVSDHASRVRANFR